VRIIGAGLPRTGTSTLCAALDRLGLGPCYHARETLRRLDHIGQWLAAYDGGPVPYRLLAGYQVTTDAPSCFFWRELTGEYPRAKVILTVRDAGSWYRSTIRTVLRQDLYPASADPALAGLRQLAQAANKYFYRADTEEAPLVERFHRHNAEVRAAVPADRLLVYEVAQGWPPLCEFLGVPVPDTPFPWLNSTAEYAAKIEQRRTR